MKRFELTLTKGFLMSLMMVLMAGFFTSCSDDDDEQLTGICTVAGRVVDGDGNPIEGADISIVAVGYALPQAKGKSDAGGEYKIVVKEATATLVVTAECEGYRSSSMTLSNIPFTGGDLESLGVASITAEDLILPPK